MAESKKVSVGTSSNTPDWEVVSLTASTYAASPGPVKYEQPNANIDKEFDIEEKESYDTNSMSQYSLSMKDDYEGLKIEAMHSEIHNKITQEDLLLGDNDIKETAKSLESSNEIILDDNLNRIDLFKKEKELSSSGIGFGKSKVLQDDILFNSSKFEAFHAKAGESFHSNEGTNILESVDSWSQTEDVPPDQLHASVDKKENKHTGSEPRSGSWWKKQAIAMYNYAKEPDRFWTILVTAAFVGLVILGQRRQREKPHLEELTKINNEVTNSMLKPVNIKSVIVNDHHFNSLVDGGTRFSIHGTY